MNTGTAYSLLLAALVFLVVIDALVIEPRLYRRRKNASASLECERVARENTRPRGNCDVFYGGRRLP